QDAANLAWKLAAVLKGEASEGLLDTYGTERLPVAQITVEQAYARYIRRVTPEWIAPDTPEMRDELTMEIGQFYRSEAICDGRASGEPACMHPDETRGRPGSRVPHAWLEDGTSTLDAATHGLALLTGPGGSAWRMAAETGASATEVVELDHLAAERCGIDPAGAMLVRPDAFVAWRSVNGAKDPPQILDRVLRQALGRR